jgi:L-lactate dehydrogenase complex protein LldE
MMKVGLFVTCLVDTMRPEIGFSTVKLLESVGCEIVFPMAQTCCGQPGFNSGDSVTARALALQFMAQFDGLDYVVVPSGSCGGMIRRHYPELFAQDPDLRGRAEAIAARTYELTSFLVDVIGEPALQAVAEQARAKPSGATVSLTYHDSCSGLRELNIHDQPRALLAQCPSVIVQEMPNARACCGFGGTFAVKYSEVSTAIADEKLAGVRATAAQCLVMGDLGCMLHLEGRMRRCGDEQTRVLHVAQVLAGEY